MLMVLLVMVGGVLGLALGALFRGPATVRVRVTPVGVRSHDGDALASTAGPLERRLDDWRLLGARISRERLVGGDLALTLHSPWWGPSPQSVHARVERAVASYVEQQTRSDAEALQTIADLESQRLDLQADRAWLIASVDDDLVAFADMVREERDAVQQQIDAAEAHVMAEQQTLSELLMRWNEFRQPVDKLSIIGLEDEIRAAEHADDMLAADRAALADARDAAVESMQTQLASIAPAAAALQTVVASFIADTSDLADRSEDLKTSAQRMIAALIEIQEATAALADEAGTLQGEVQQLEGLHIALDLRSVQRSAYDAGDTWLVAHEDAVERLNTLIEDLPQDAAHRTPALVAQNRYQRMLAHLTTAVADLNGAVRALDTEFNRPLDGAFRRLLGLNQRVEQRVDALREEVEQRMMADAEATRVAELERIEARLEPQSDRIRDLTVDLAALRSNRDDLTGVLERATAAQTTQEKRLAEASAVTRQIESLEDMIGRRLASWSPPPVVTIDAPPARDVPAQARLGTAAVISGSAFALAVVVLMVNGVVARFSRRRSRDEIGSF